MKLHDLLSLRKINEGTGLDRIKDRIVIQIGYVVAQITRDTQGLERKTRILLVLPLLVKSVTKAALTFCSFALIIFFRGSVSSTVLAGTRRAGS